MSEEKRIILTKIHKLIDVRKNELIVKISNVKNNDEIIINYGNNKILSM
jgi:hypothetical protein